MDEGSDDPAEPVLPTDEAPARLDVERAAAALGEEPEAVDEALAQAGLSPESVAETLLGTEPKATVEVLADELDRSEASVAVALADGLEVQEDALVDLARRIDADPSEFAEAIRQVHLEDLLADLDVAGWLPWDRGDAPPSVDEVVAAVRRTERQVLSGGLFAAALLVAFGLVMFNAPPLLREVIWVLLGVLLVVLGLGLVLALVRLSTLTDRYLARMESVAAEFEGDSVSVVAGVAQQTAVGRRAREAAMRKAWQLFREARAERKAEASQDGGTDDDAEDEGDDGDAEDAGDDQADEDGEGDEAGEEPSDGPPG